MLKKITCLSMLLCASWSFGQETKINVLPTPKSICILKNNNAASHSKVIINRAKTKIVVPLKAKPEELQAAQLLAKKLGLSITSNTSEKHAINFILDQGPADSEKYSLEANSQANEGSSITIRAESYRGLVWGIQTLLQLAPIDVFGKKAIDQFEIPAVKIIDEPTYKYRGMHFDVSRNFFTVSEAKKFLDYMSMHKINTLHWHLTDDQGWRIEIKKYPKLTEVGAKRRETPKQWDRDRGDGKEYGPYFYTQDDVREIVAYATSLGIEVIPEIEMPGHAQAALAAYPQFGCKGGPYETWTKWGVSTNVYCAGNDEVLKFIKDVLDEVIPLFPSQYIHIGGDECPKDEWQKCSKCRARLSSAGVRSFHELQTWFIRNIQNYLLTKNKHIIGWDEILCKTLPKTATIMSWQGVDPGIRAARTGYQVIMTPNNYLYFDYSQGKGPNEPESIGGYVGLETIYSFDVGCGLPENFRKNIRGAQANCWSEYFHSFSRLEYAVLPRIAALAEITWTAPEMAKRDITQFQGRLLDNIMRYDQMGANFRFVPPQFNAEILFTDKYVLKMPSIAEGAKLEYTIDDGETCNYTQPLTFSKNSQIKYWLVMPTGKKSRVETINFKKVVPRPSETINLENTTPGLTRNMKKGLFMNCRNPIAPTASTQKDITDLTIYGDATYPRNNYRIDFTGYFVAPETACYTFYMRSDDGSILWVGDQDKPLIDNDGLHSDAEVKSAMVYLEKGYHSFRVHWFDAGGGKSLKMNSQINDQAQIPVEKSNFITNKE